MEIEIWSSFSIDLQKEQDSNAHGSAWIEIEIEIQIEIDIGIGNIASSLKGCWHSVDDSVHQVMCPFDGVVTTQM